MKYLYCMLMGCIIHLSIFAHTPDTFYERIELVIRQSAERNALVRKHLTQVEGLIATLNDSYATTAATDREQLAQQAALCRASQREDLRAINRKILELSGELYQLSARDTHRKRDLQRRIRALKQDKHRLLRPMIIHNDITTSSCDGTCVALRIEVVTLLAETILQLIDVLESLPQHKSLESLCAQARVAEQQQRKACDIEADRITERLGHAVAQAYR